MWESILKKEQWEIQVDLVSKSLCINIGGQQQADSGGQHSLQLDQSDLFELMHALLTINRSFNNETMYYDDHELMDPA